MHDKAKTRLTIASFTIKSIIPKEIQPSREAIFSLLPRERARSPARDTATNRVALSLIGKPSSRDRAGKVCDYFLSRLAMNEILSTDRAPAAIGPYSQGVRTGNILFLSGQLGLDPASGTLPEGVKAQSEQAFRNVAALLEAAGMTFANVVKVTIFITDLDYFSTVNDAMIAAFDGLPYPARSCVVVADLPKHGLVEVEAVAAL